MNTGKVSVIIPVYNVVNELRYCLDSVLSQSFRNFEVICVNDGSTDDCGKILEEYASRDLRFKIITQENKGLSEARNVGLDAATGEYVIFVDSDDMVDSEILAKTVAEAQSEGAQMVSFGFKRIVSLPLDLSKSQTSSERCVTTNPLERIRARDDLRCYPFAWLHLYRRDFIGDKRFIPGIFFEDYPFVISLLKKHPKTVILSDHLYYYMSREDSIMGSAVSKFTLKHIESYRAGLLSIADCYRDVSEEDKKIVREKVISNYLKQSLNKIRRQSRDARAPLYAAFVKLLLELKGRGMLTRSGHRLRHYLRYRYLMWRYSK